MSNRNDFYAHSLLSRAMYLQFCKHKGFDPRPYPYSDDAGRDYATVAINYLGYDDHAIKLLEDEVAGEW
jgi:hypothetical protein